jgi:DNA-binding HxlR family transcriptional regulator
LNTRLGELREAGIVALIDGSGFALTPEGERLLGELMGLYDWAERWAKRRA